MQLDQVFHALSDTTRRKILIQIRDEDKTVNDIASKFKISLPAISKHLKVLESAGLISRVKQGQKRLCHSRMRKSQSRNNIIIRANDRNDIFKNLTILCRRPIYDFN